jgi:hypothetical protein
MPRGVEDIRLHLSFFKNAKVADLQDRFGAEGVLCLLRLWSWAGFNAPTGDLRLTAHGIETMAEWHPRAQKPGEKPGDFCSFLVQKNLLEKIVDQGGLTIAFRVHDWSDFQSWALGAEARHRKAKKAAKGRYEKEDESE